ncbi:MAG: hypothetical protein U1E33_05335 [Rhodospirillales bacterium]
MRLKRFIEMRGADGGRGTGCARCRRSGVGLLYDEDACAEAWEMCRDWTGEERAKLRAGCRATR